MSHVIGLSRPNTLWKGMMTSSNGNIFSVTCHLCGEFTHKGQWHGALMFSLICTWINGWVNNRDAGDLRRHNAHYDVIVMGQLNALLQMTFWNTFSEIRLIELPFWITEICSEVSNWQLHSVGWIKVFAADDEPLFELGWLGLLKHIFVTQPRWVKSPSSSNAYICQ